MELNVTSIQTTEQLDALELDEYLSCAHYLHIVYPVAQRELDRICNLPSQRYILENNMGELFYAEKPQ